MAIQGGATRLVRDATTDDAVACAAIYAHYVADTAATFETVAPAPAQMAERIASAQLSHAWLVLEGEDGAVVGYAAAAPYKARPAYRWACELSIYLSPTHTGRGSGRLLYSNLLKTLTSRGYRTVTAAVTVPNASSVGLHVALGFRPVGTFARVGYKFGAWQDVTWFQKHLEGLDDDQPPVEPH